MSTFRWTLWAAALALPVTLLAAEPVTAQMFYRQWSYYGHPYPRPPADIRPAPLPPSEIIDILADDYRYKRIGQPQFAGHVYVVDGIDRTGAVVRSYVDAFSGRVIDVELLQRAPRQIGPAPRIARLPDEAERLRTTPFPPRRPPEQGARPNIEPSLRQAARPTGSTTIVPLSREPRVVNPADVRVPDEPDRAPPLARR